MPKDQVFTTMNLLRRMMKRYKMKITIAWIAVDGQSKITKTIKYSNNKIKFNR